MKFFLSIFLSSFLLLSFSLVNAQSKDEVAIRSLLNKQTLAWNRGSVDDFMQGYWQNDSLMFIGKSGVTYGWNQTLANYKKHYPDTAQMGKLDFTIIKVKMLSFQYAQVIGKWHLARSVGDLEGHFTLLMRKIKGQWVVICDHSS